MTKSASGIIWSSLAAATLTIAVLLTTPASSAADEIPEQGARYNSKTWECTVWPDRYRLKVAHRLTIYNPRGEQYAGLQIVENGFSNLKSVSARVVGPDGDVLYTRNKKDFTKACGYGQTELYTDVCTYSLSLQGPQFPYTVEYEYEIEGSSLFFWRGEDFQDEIPVDSACYTLWLGGNVDFRHKIIGRGIYMGSVADKRGEGVRWEARNLPALVAVEHVPPGAKTTAGIVFMPTSLKLGKYAFNGDTWADIGLWYRDLAAEQYLPSAPGGAVDSGATMPEIARRCYDEVTDKVRYVAVEIGVGGWKPDVANRTELRGYGDCKDMATLLVSKLRQHGIESYPVLVLTRSAGWTDTAFPGFEFNHVITAAIQGSDTVWMDPTCETCPFGELPQGDEDINVLVVTEQGGVLRHTPPSVAEDNLLVRRTSVRFGADLQPVIVSEQTVTGNYAQYLRQHLPSLDNEDMRRFVHALFPGGEKQYRVLRYEIRNLEDAYGPVVISVEAQRLKPLDRIGKSIYCNPFLFNELVGYEKVDLVKRGYPIDLYYPDSEHDTITISWDSSLAVDSIVMPKTDSATFAFTDISVTSRLLGDSVAVAVTHAYRAYMVDTAQFADFEAFRSLVRDISSRYVKLVVK
jgi:hypothetical protein